MKWCEVYKLGGGIPVWGWAVKIGSSGVTLLRSEKSCEAGIGWVYGAEDGKCTT